MCTNMFAWLLKILCQTFIAFDQNKIIYDKKKKKLLQNKDLCNQQVWIIGEKRPTSKSLPRVKAR